MSAVRFVPLTVKDCAAEVVPEFAVKAARLAVEGEIVGTVTVPLRAMVADP